jgi:hypothetical protein
VGKTLHDRWVRLTSMSGDELLDRVRQHLHARVDGWKYGLGSDFKIRPRRVDPHKAKPQFFFSADEVPGLCQLLKERLPKQAQEIVDRAQRISRHQLDLLGFTNLDYGPEIDWHSDRVHGKRAPRRPFHQIRYLDFAEVGDAKITWELNRHQQLVTLAKAYRLTGDERFAAEIFNQWEHWHKENPYPIGINWASSLEVAFRSLSWLWTRFLLEDCPVAPPAFQREWTQALGVSGRHIERYLSTYFSPNTHLLGEAVALFSIGTLCPELPSAARWKQRGWDIVVREAERQVRGDGFHFEQSTYYHVYALDLFLHARILAVKNRIAVPAVLDAKLEKMLTALFLLSRAGPPPAFGDDDGGRVFDPSRNRSRDMLDPLATGAVLFWRGDFKALVGDVREETLWLLGQEGIAEFDTLPAAKPPCASVAFPDSGFCVMTQSAEAQLVVDAGPQGEATAGHGHADALSVCLTSKGGPLLIDPGTCEYVGDGDERDKFRGTAAHNTLRIDELDQADPNGPFAWTSLPAVAVERWIAGENFDLFVGSHNAYSRLPSPVLVRRWVFSRKGSFWFVRDRVEGEGQHRLELSWHLAPDLTGQDGTTFLSADRTRGLALLTEEGHVWSQEIFPGVWSPAYGQRQPAPVLHFSTMAPLPSEFVTLLLPLSAGKWETGRLTRISGESESVCGYRYRDAEGEHSLFFALRRGPWRFGNWGSDAEFLYWHVGRDSRSLVLCGGTYLDVAGQRLVSLQTTAHCEVVETDRSTKVLSPGSRSVEVHRSLSSIRAELEPALVADSPGHGKNS